MVEALPGVEERIFVAVNGKRKIVVGRIPLGGREKEDEWGSNRTWVMEDMGGGMARWPLPRP